MVFFHVEQRADASILSVLGRHLLGMVSLVVGVILSVPGVPGPGFFFCTAALFLIQFPKKRALLLALNRKRWFRVVRVVVRKRMRVLVVLPRHGRARGEIDVA